MIQTQKWDIQKVKIGVFFNNTWSCSWKAWFSNVTIIVSSAAIFSSFPAAFYAELVDTLISTMKIRQEEFPPFLADILQKSYQHTPPAHLWIRQSPNIMLSVPGVNKSRQYRWVCRTLLPFISCLIFQKTGIEGNE